MKTGKPTRLSEKLDTVRAEHVASISSQLKSFRIDLKNIVGAAQHTIASDTRRFQTEVRDAAEIDPPLADNLALADRRDGADGDRLDDVVQPKQTRAVVGESGAGARWHCLPSLQPSLTVVWTGMFAGAILGISALGFLGLGVQPPRPEWGTMLLDASIHM